MYSLRFQTLILASLLLIPFGSIFADTISVSPVSGSYAIGQTFTVRILVSSPAQAINALSGTLSFPPDKLQVTSISKIGSILSLWVVEPSFSNSRGTVTFEGVVPNPGFAERDGRVLGINFRVVGTGPANVALTSGSLLANDGLGTNVLRTLGSANYTLEESSSQPEATSTPPAVIETSDDAEGVSPVVEPAKQFSFNLPNLEVVYAWTIKSLSLLIPLLALFYLLIQLLKKGKDSVSQLRRRVENDLAHVDRLVDKTFELLKEDINESINMLERARTKRKLTSEENAIIHHFRQNLVDANRIIHKEIKQAQKDIKR